MKNVQKIMLEGVFREQEIEFLKNNLWYCTEKVDGTNIRIVWDGHNMSFQGRTANAEIPKRLMNALTVMFKGTINEELFERKFRETQAILFWEVYISKIQKGKHFKVNWKNGRTTYIRGCNFEDACHSFGIGRTIKSGIDSWEECEELPRESKQIIIMDIEGEPEYLSGKLSFIQQIRTQLLKNSEKVDISVNDVIYHYLVTENPFEFILKKIINSINWY